MRDRPKYNITLAQAVNGDRQSTEHLLLENYERLESRIAAQLPKSLRSIVQVEDVLQDTFVHAIRSMPQCHATSKEAFSAWLDQIANRRVLDVIRLLQSQKRGGRWARRWKRSSESSWGALDSFATDSTPGRGAARLEVIARMNEAIDDLPADQREAMRIRYLGGRSLDETARTLDRSPAAVRGLIHRAKQRLREMLHSSSRWFDTS